ncbi:hypothetical protein Q5752_004812 [Cryptotrichosporon argae]
MASTRASPARPSIELLSNTSNGGYNDEDDDGETIESLTSKLAIERKVQYGAEKMLDVIEKRTGDEGDQEQVKERIVAQLEAANEHIKALEARLERLRGGESARGTPLRHRRRPQRLNGYASASSINHLSSSASSNLLSSAARPRLGRFGTSAQATPERRGDGHESGGSASTPSRRDLHRRRRSLSLGEDSLSGESYGLAGRSGDSAGTGSVRGSQGAWIPTPVAEHIDEDGTDRADEARALIRRLRERQRVERASKGKSPERGDDVCDGLMRLAELVKKHPAVVATIDPADVVHAVLPCLADTATSRRRSATYRLLRYFLTRPTWGTMLEAGVEWTIIRTFTRDVRAVHERESALRLLRAAVTLPALPKRATSTASSPSSPLRARTRSDQPAPRSRLAALNPPPDPVARLLEHTVPLTEGLVRAIVSAAENPDDAMRTVCMQTLVEIALLDLQCLLRADAFRVVLNALKDGPLELGPAVAGLLLYLINQPATRHLLVAGSDLETVLVGLTEEYGKVAVRQLQRHLDKLQTCVRNVTLLLGSWSGLLYLCMYDFRAIKSLISSLHVPMTEMRNALLDLFFTAFRIEPPSWSDAFLDGRRLTVYNRTQQAHVDMQDDADDDEVVPRLNLVDQYVAFLLAVFVEAGLLEALVALIREDTGALNRKATLLLGETLQLANRILPLQYAARLQALPQLFNGVADFANPGERNAALSALSSIDSLNRNQRKAGQTAQRDRTAPSIMQDSLQRGQKQVQQVKLRLGLQIEDKQFQQMVNDSGVLLGRDHAKWNYDIIMDLLQGPLLNPRRLDEAIKATKFVRRLFSFFHPYNNRFSSIKRTRPNHKWVRLGCTLLSTLLASAEGIRFIIEDKLLRQMVDCLSELDQYAGQLSAQPVFARDRLENSLTYGYFEMIGTLSRHREGMRLLEKFKFFTAFYHLSELRSRDDIIKLIIECFDYSIDAHQRVVLSKALTSSYIDTRLFATHHLGRLLHEAPELTDWTLQLLATQLYDTALEVCEIAVMYLEEACSEAGHLEKVVQLRPTLSHLGDIGYPLFIRFMSTSAGFRYLHQAGYVERELDTWLTERNLLYVVETETFVSKTVRPFTSDTVEDYWTYEGTAPTHFFGELTKTPEGCSFLRERGLVADLAEVIRLHGMEAGDAAVLTTVKSALWAMGNIGATERGLPFLEDEEIIDAIVEIAEQSPVLTMKGTCFFVLGLISSTRMGAEILEEYGWVSTRTPMGMTTGLCLPNDLSRFVQIEPWDRPEIAPTTPPLPALTGVEGDIMLLFSTLSVPVSGIMSHPKIKYARQRHARLFSSVTFFHRALRLISTSHFTATIRRFILDQFAVALEPDTLLRLRHIELQAHVTPLVPYGARDAPAPGQALEDADGDDDDGHDARPRARSSPGPEPPGRPTRARGLTVSELTPLGPEAKQHLVGFK